MYQHTSAYATSYSDEHGARSTHAHATLTDATEHAKRIAALAGSITHTFDGEFVSGFTDDARIWNVSVSQRCITPNCGEYLPLGGITRTELDDETGTPVQVNYQTCGYCDDDARERLTEPRTTRAAEFFGQARAARHDVWTLSPTPTVLAPYFVSGTLLGKFPAQIIGEISRETRAYLVKYLHNGEESLSFSHELVLV